MVTQVSQYAAVQDLFDQTATRFSNSLAIDNGARRVTYAELQTAVERIAQTLARRGVGDGSIVGIFLSDPIGIISSILATLKTGGVFCSLDPAFPARRLQVMFEAVSPKWCITDSRFAEKLREVTGLDHEVVMIDDLRETESYKSVAELRDPNAPCSIYFTSGSTGKPKAILGRLKGIDHFIRWEIETVGASSGTRVTQLASPSFDGFLKDAFVPLCSGGVVCAPENRSIILDPGKLIDWIDVEQINVLHCVPSVFRSLISHGLNSHYFEALRYVVMAGEHLYPSDVKRWMDVFGERIKLINIYGPTETTLTKWFHVCTAADAAKTSVPVGKPIRGAAMMVIDQHGQPCSVGDIGEIYIRTPYCALGYYREPELTAEVFIQNPFNDDPNDIVYKTGDYGRLLPDGNFEVLGRRDDQVKIRGVRIELGEIENLLRGNTAVGDVAVIDREDSAGNKILVAYVTLNNGVGNNGAGPESLRQYLLEHLPEEMLPSAFVQLERLPRTLNGKIDRKALPDLEEVHAEREVGEALPRGPVEEIVAGIWADVLKLSAVRRDDNFFTLGGHSLLVTQAILRVRDILKVELPIRSLFEAPTVAEFAELINKRIAEGSQRELSAIERVSREGELPLSYAQQRMWFYEHLANESASFHIPLGLRVKGPLNYNALEQTFGEIIRRHESLRTSFPAVDDRPLQVIHEPTRFHLPIVDLSTLPQETIQPEAARLAQEETLRRFDLATGPLVRPTLIRLAPQEHIIICTMHHIIADGQSFEVVIAEMSQLFAALNDGIASPLAELTVQYVDYAAWQRQWLQGKELETRLDYWRKQLAGAPRRMSLPQHQTRKRVQRFRGARQDIVVSPELTNGLKELTRREGMTLLMTLFSGFVLLLNRFSGAEDIVVGATYANRERPEAEKVIGILANTLVLRVNLAGAESFRELMQRVREVCLGAYSNQLTPELLREDLALRGEERDRLFEVWFQFEREEREKLEMKGLEWEWYRVHQQEPKFELSLMLSEANEKIAGMLEYDTALYDDETMTEMVKSYLRLLEQAVADPDARL